MTSHVWRGLSNRADPTPASSSDEAVSEWGPSQSSATGRQRVLDGRVAPRSTPGARLWVASALLIVTIGVSLSVVAAQGTADRQHERARQAFLASSAQISSTLKLALQHEQDLAVSAGAFIADDPDATEVQFRQWTGAVEAFGRYPELQGIANIALVPASGLSAFASRAVADPAGPLGPNGTFDVIPQGSRSYYCLLTVSVSRTPQSTTPSGLDYCDTVLGPSLLRTRNTGTGTYIPFNEYGPPGLAIGTPVYRGGSDPATVAARQAAFVGWTGVQILPSVLLKTALLGHPGMGVAFTYSSTSSKATFTAGRAMAGSQASSTDLGNGWSVRTYGMPGSQGIFSNADRALVVDGWNDAECADRQFDHPLGHEPISCPAPCAKTDRRTSPYGSVRLLDGASQPVTHS